MLNLPGVKLAYLSSSIIPSRSANSIHVMKMCQALTECGHEVTLFAPDARKEVEAGVKDCYEYYGVKPFFILRKIVWFKWLGRAYFSGILIAVNAALGSYRLAFARCLPSAFFAALLRVPVIFEYHQPVSDSGRLAKLNEFLFKRLIRHKSFVGFVAITHALKTHYLARYPELEGRICVAPDGSDPFPFHCEAVTLSSPSGRLQVGYVGQLYSGKGMEVVSKLCHLAPFADFHVVGGLQPDIEKWKTEIKADNIAFHGYVPHAQAPGFISAFDVLLLPNQNKVTWHKAGGDIGQWTSPLKMFEYMSAGKPIISSDLPVLREILQDDVNALLCPPEDITAWVNALKRLEDPSLRERLGKRALSDFICNYTWKRRAQTIMEHFQDAHGGVRH
ncbi:glycosyltransferase family 4 protein [Ectopseudomonas alcaliphila]|uniref:glycosyltransferase family 4 protein n=1 Tax=Ectopseudomonas alcaliphila TaxID=101564 RepID=UPI0027808091|nr:MULTISPECIES: glycosyltransferase family 4 protein [Pseudomonas]MDP9940111.1 glycosyltransferase involved in cell wall biosynthesis [Pseudomonas sp. 3400]MDR7012322.1 glycosyltransferase involved in cell wall biosynthesis [Pseudomonas alcaliphila]